MKIGILGSGLMGGTLGTIWARAGHAVTFSYARSQAKLERLAREAGARAGTPADAVREADAALLAVHWSRVDDVLGCAGDLAGTVVLTCCVPLDLENTDLVVGTTTSGAEELARRLPRARLVAAFNTKRSAPRYPQAAAAYLLRHEDRKAKGQVMKIVRAGAQASTPGPEEWFTGRVRIDPLFAAEEPGRAAGASVTFEPGARTAWHTHPLGQTLIVTQGVGRVGREGGPVEEIRPGDVVWFPAGEKHWHGAAPDVAMSHIAVQEVQDGSAVTWLEKVSDADYAG